MSRLSRFGVSFFMCLAVTGCDSGPALGTVTGQVTMDGKPLPNVAVTFIPAAGGGSASGITDASGKYELNYLDRKGALIGKHKVAVTTVQQPQSKIDMSQIPSDSPEYAKALEASQGGYNVIFKEPIPEKYNDKSELQYEVKSGSQTINLDLKSS